MTDQDKRLRELTKQATQSYEALADEMGVQGIPQWMLSDAMIQAQARDDYRWQLRLDAAERRVKELEAANPCIQYGHTGPTKDGTCFDCGTEVIRDEPA